MKKCSTCHKELPESAFHDRVFTPSGRKGKRGKCRKCSYARRKLMQTRRRYALRVEYGLTLSQYNEMLAEQGGGCALCGCLPENSAKGTLAVDHNHTTGKVRGLLCGACNMGIGQLKDNPALLRAAADYLDRTN